MKFNTKYMYILRIGLILHVQDRILSFTLSRFNFTSGMLFFGG